MCMLLSLILVCEPPNYTTQSYKNNQYNPLAIVSFYNGTVGKHPRDIRLVPLAKVRILTTCIYAWLYIW